MKWPYAVVHYAFILVMYIAFCEVFVCRRNPKPLNLSMTIIFTSHCFACSSVTHDNKLVARTSEHKIIVNLDTTFTDISDFDALVIM